MNAKKVLSDTNNLLQRIGVAKSLQKPKNDIYT